MRRPHRRAAAQTSFQSGSGSEDLWVRAFEGFDWSASLVFFLGVDLLLLLCRRIALRVEWSVPPDKCKQSFGFYREFGVR
jgi:hypothetical protein